MVQGILSIPIHPLIKKDEMREKLTYGHVLLEL